METTIPNDRNDGGRKSPTSTPSVSPIMPTVPIRQYTTTSHTTVAQQSVAVKTQIAGLINPVTTADTVRSPMRLINEIKTASQESQASQADSGHGSAQPHTTSSEFQPFYKSNELFENNPATESSKLLNTPSRRLDQEGEERAPTPLGGGMGMTSCKMDLERSKRESS